MLKMTTKNNGENEFLCSGNLIKKSIFPKNPQGEFKIENGYILAGGMRILYMLPRHANL